MTMIELDKILKPLDAKVLRKGPGFEDKKIGNVIASDLMSDVLVVDKSDLLLVTSLASDQVIRTADIVGAVAVMVVNGKTLPATMLDLAEELDMSLLLTSFTKFQACVRLGQLMEVH